MAIETPAFKMASSMNTGSSVQKAFAGSAGQKNSAIMFVDLKRHAEHQHGSLSEAFDPATQAAGERRSADPACAPQQQHVKHVHADVLEQVQADERRPTIAATCQEQQNTMKLRKFACRNGAASTSRRLSSAAGTAAGSGIGINSKISATPSARQLIMIAKARRTSAPP